MAKKKGRRVAKKKVKRESSHHDALLDKLKRLESGGAMGGGGDAEFWRPKPGRHTIRILPPVGNMEFFFMHVARHWIDRKPYICPNVTDNLGDECPMCEESEDLRRSSSKADIQAGKDLLPRKQFWMNIVVRKGKGDDFEGPFVFTPGISIFEEITALIRDPDYGDLLTDPLYGIDLRLEREGTGRTDTSYSLYPGRQEGPINPEYEDDEDGMWDWLEASAEDLSEFVVMPSYDELLNALEGVPEEEEDDDDEEEAFRRASKKRGKKKSKKKSKRR